ncbi:MAG: transcriptional regulator GcvA [Desulfobacteraceae bacterium]|nr:transcriptional regulator GcvA [Desulfobacteraceae bacterium]
MQKPLNRARLPLNALRSFESAARHLSFTKAASELNVTQGAVSRQVKLLEEQLDVILFHRLHRQLKLTAQGQLLLPQLTDAFNIVADAVQRLVSQTKDLNLKVHPTFAIRWLIPRLHNFQARYPKIQVRFTTSNVNVDFKQENFDLGITYRGEKIPGTARKKILTERLTPVCAPVFLTGETPLKNYQDLRNHLLLHNNPDQREWRLWAGQAKVDGLSFERGQIFEIDDAALQAATAGLGVALGDLLLVQEDLKTKRLVAPFDYIEVKTGNYYISWLEKNESKPGVKEFQEWLVKEIDPDIS